MIDTVTVWSLDYLHLISGPNKGVWTTPLVNDLGRLAQILALKFERVRKQFFVCP